MWHSVLSLDNVSPTETMGINSDLHPNRTFTAFSALGVLDIFYIPHDNKYFNIFYTFDVIFFFPSSIWMTWVRCVSVLVLNLYVLLVPSRYTSLHSFPFLNFWDSFIFLHWLRRHLRTSMSSYIEGGLVYKPINNVLGRNRWEFEPILNSNGPNVRLLMFLLELASQSMK